MNNWDKVEKTKRPVTNEDINWIYFKTGLFIFGSVLYFYFVIMGYTLKDIMQFRVGEWPPAKKFNTLYLSI